MKARFSILISCVLLTVFVLAGCGKENPGVSPSGAADGSPSGDSLSPATMVTGIASFINDDIITLDVIRQEEAPLAEGVQALSVDSVTYVITDENASVGTDANTAVVTEYQGYSVEPLNAVAEGDLLAVVLRGDTAVVIIDRGPADAYFKDTDTEGPTDEPAGSDAPASPGVTDSSEKKTYTITTDGLKVRSGPGTSYSVLGVLDTGSRETGAVSDGWLAFTYNGKTGYCSADFIAVSTAPEGVPDSAESKTYKTTDYLVARDGPGTSYHALGTLKKGTEVKGPVADGWLKFTYEEKTAYCSASYLSEG